MATHIRSTLLRTGFRISCTSNVESAIGSSNLTIPVRCLSRLRTKTKRKAGGFWIERMAPPLFDRSAIVQKLEDQPESKFDIVAPALITQSSSVFYDPLFNKFKNMIMWDGKKAVADEIMRLCFEKIKTTQMEKYHAADDVTKAKTMINPLKIFHQAVENCKPVLALMPLKRGGVTYQIPIAVTAGHAEWTSMKWLILAGRDHERKVHLKDCLARELISAANNEGRVIKRKHDLHKQCEANKAYAHYRWSR